MRKKKFFLITIIFICIYFMLQTSHNVSEIISDRTEQIFDTKSDYTLTDWTDNILFEGVQEVSDTPWNFNAGIINMENDGDCILLLPNTSATLTNINASETELLTFSYKIHPWVSDSSDGAGLLVWILDDADNILLEQAFSVSADADWKDFSIDFTDYTDATKIKLLCNNGGNNNNNGDWIVVKLIQEDVINSSETIFSTNGYVKSATYFADEWPINFWNSEMDNLEADMNQIKTDGFDSIILVIPWREFQPEVSPVSYNDYAFEKLNDIMLAADAANLNVYARIGYSWDFYCDSHDDITNRYYNLLGDPQTQAAWFEYVEKMYSFLSDYSNFEEAFLTWEDFWNAISICDDTLSSRLEKASYIGYQNWVENNYSINEYNKAYQTSYETYETIPIPQRNESAMEAMYAFYDDFLNALLAKSQSAFPNLSMEVRMDWDIVYQEDGSVKYYKHNSTYLCENSSFTATMYGIPMGFENSGERVTYTDAMEKTEYILQRLKTENSGKPVYIEQFLFADNTPAFKNNAQIKDSDLNLYLENISGILLENSEGYGIWTYRNYRGNMIYNAQFALLENGWNVSGAVSFVTSSSGSNICYLKDGGCIAQEIPEIRNHFDNETYMLEMDITELNHTGSLQISVGAEMQEVEVKETGTLSLTFSKNSSFDICILSAGLSAGIDNIRLYSFIQDGYLYDENNHELQCITGIRALNNSLESTWE